MRRSGRSAASFDLEEIVKKRRRLSLDEVVVLVKVSLRDVEKWWRRDLGVRVV